jgi:hypothetical protein
VFIIAISMIWCLGLCYAWSYASDARADARRAITAA